VTVPLVVGAGNIRDWHSLPVPEWDRGACKFLNLQILETAAAAKPGTVTKRQSPLLLAPETSGTGSAGACPGVGPRRLQILEPANS